jgi:ATP diphosphatase
VFVAALLEERGGPALDRILEAIHAKMVERHPHVFGDVELSTAEEVGRLWESSKARRADAPASVLDGVPASLPSLLAAYRMTQKAAGVGFDWPDVDGVLDKVAEEIEELRAALREAPAAGAGSVTAEAGDLLFALANLCRHLGADPEATLAAANLKFRRRFARVERQLAEEGLRPGDADLAHLERLWQRAKALEGA